MSICPPSSPLDVAVSVKIHTLLGVRLVDDPEDGSVIFDVKARMEEKERRGGQISIGFALKVATRPNVAKYEVEGVALLQGKDEEMQRMLEVNPETQIPFVFQRVYQQVFMSMYVLSTLIGAPYPPANLLSSHQQLPAARMAPDTPAERNESPQPARGASAERATTSEDAQPPDTGEVSASELTQQDRGPVQQA